MRKIAAITMSALIGFAPLVSAAEAQTGSPVQTIEPQAPPKQQAQPKQQNSKQQWKKGGKYSGKGSVVANHRRHKLGAPPRGHTWVRDGNDFLLVATATGIIASAVRAAGN